MASQVPIPREEAPPKVLGQTYWDKGWQKCKEQPFVPLGVLATCVALIGATHQMRRGNRESFNRFLRFRVVAQGVTVAGCVIGSVIYSREATIQKAVKRQEELEKIRVAGTRPVAAENVTSSPPSTLVAGESPSPATETTAPSTPTPPTPATSESLWRKWGVKTDGKS